MKFDNIDNKLQKIQQILTILKANEDMSSIEKKLMLDYIKRLYQAVDSIPVTNGEVDIDLGIEDNIKTEGPAMAASSSSATNPPAKVEVPSVEVTKAQTIVEELVQDVDVPKIEFSTPIQVIGDSTKKRSKNIERYEELFGMEEVSDLSDKLAMAKISDIKSAIGLNEKIFTINELFSGDSECYNQTVSALNVAKSFEEAKEILSNDIIEQFNWMEESKIKKAQQFVKIVRRLYSA